MTLMGAFGCGLIGFGPVGILFCLTVASDPLQVILFTISAFFWLVGLLVSSLIWFAVVPLRDQIIFGLIFACILQEIMRFLFYLLMSKAEYGIQKLLKAEHPEVAECNSVDGSSTVSPQEPRGPSIFDFRKLSLTSGLAFALMGSIIEYIYVFYDVIGPATLFDGPNPGHFFMFAALDSCFMALLQVAWSVILFRAYRLCQYLQIFVVVALHVLSASLCLLNGWPSPAPEFVCGAFALMVLTCTLYAFWAAGGRLSGITRTSSPTFSTINIPNATSPTITTTTTTVAAKD